MGSSRITQGAQFGAPIHKGGDVCILIYKYIINYIYLWLIHFVVQQKLRQHCKVIIAQF